MNEENDKLWQVLGQAKPTEASPYFVRKVMREVREKRPSPWVLWLRWLVPTSAVAAVAVFVFSGQEPKDDDFNVYFDTAADLQSLVAYEDTALWTGAN